MWIQEPAMLAPNDLNDDPEADSIPTSHYPLRSWMWIHEPAMLAAGEGTPESDQNIQTKTVPRTHAASSPLTTHLPPKPPTWPSLLGDPLADTVEPRRQGPQSVAIYLDGDHNTVYLNVDPGCGYTSLPCSLTIRHVATGPRHAITSR